MIDSGNSLVMPVSPMYGYGNGGFGNSFGSDFWLIFILLFAFGGFGGWGAGEIGRASCRERVFLDV